MSEPLNIREAEDRARRIVDANQDFDSRRDLAHDFLALAALYREKCRLWNEEMARSTYEYQRSNRFEALYREAVEALAMWERWYCEESTEYARDEAWHAGQAVLAKARAALGEHRHGGPDCSHVGQGSPLDLEKEQPKSALLLGHPFKRSTTLYKDCIEPGCCRPESAHRADAREEEK